MGSGCTRICSKKKVAPAPIMGGAVMNLEVKPKETPNGCCFLYTGASTSDNKHTCPILAVHTWDKSMQNMRKEIGGIHIMGTQNNTRNTVMLDNVNENVERKVGVNQDIEMLPIEDILSIKISTEVKKAVEQEQRVVIQQAPRDELTCGQKLKNALCCRGPVAQAPEHRIDRTEKRNATRTITVTIERIHYSLIDTPSHLRAVSERRQEQFYDENLRKRTIKFHYLCNEIFDENEYTMHLRQCEDLARLVMQLKAMSNDYPDEAKLQKIVQQNYIQHYGQTLDREIQNLQGTPDVAAVTIYGNHQQ
ncbi:unnamed protein product [Adineta steineri]|uniref:Uncharacterized protein n=1 Tax=Adineta steineri TaxID=433720 RepID=A0A819QSC6_9BILA|nr:unnamed protein product [Adineta steineri]CAF4028827.1 unnamed protein product [Adineta steineri]